MKVKIKGEKWLSLSQSKRSYIVPSEAGEVGVTFASLWGWIRQLHPLGQTFLEGHTNDISYLSLKKVL